jgi:hypothetical protein
MLTHALMFKRVSAAGGSVFSAAAGQKKAGLIEKETYEGPTSNIQYG